MAKTYELLPEHRAQLHSWHRKWVSIAVRSEPQTSADRSAMIEAINGLYDAASIPRPRHIVFAPSPLAGQIAAGFAAAIWHLHEHRNAAVAAARATIWTATLAATEAAPWATIWTATLAATEAATEAAPYDSMEASWWNAMTAATRAATVAAMWDAKSDATVAAVRDATLDATEATARGTTRNEWVGTDAAMYAAKAMTTAVMWAVIYVALVAALVAANLATEGGAMSAATVAVIWAAAAWGVKWAGGRALMWATAGNATLDTTEAATRPATLDTMEAATEAATLAATGNATMAAMWEATEAATWDATWAATWDSMMDATRAATWDATRDATGRATRGATREAWARRLATLLMPTAPDVLCACAVGALRMCNEGNMSAVTADEMSAFGPPAMSAVGADVISFFRHVVKLPLDYGKWHHYEEAAIHGGWRFMHPEFCIVVDFPERLLIDAQNRPHCADGPSHRWRDGFQIFHWHGLRIDPAHEWIVTDKAKIDKRAILAEPNSELRRAMCEIAGWNNAIAMLGGKIVARDEIHGQRRELLDIGLGNGETARLIRLANGTAEEDGTRSEFIEGVPPNVATPHDAEAWQYGISAQWYKEACRS